MSHTIRTKIHLCIYILLCTHICHWRRAIKTFGFLKYCVTNSTCITIQFFSYVNINIALCYCLIKLCMYHITCIRTSRESCSRSTDEPISSSRSSLNPGSGDVMEIVSALWGCPSSSTNSPLSERLSSRLLTLRKLGVAGQVCWSGERFGVEESAGNAP